MNQEIAVAFILVPSIILIVVAWFSAIPENEYTYAEDREKETK